MSDVFDSKTQKIDAIDRERIRTFKDAMRASAISAIAFPTVVLTAINHQPARTLMALGIFALSRKLVNECGKNLDLLNIKREKLERR